LAEQAPEVGVLSTKSAVLPEMLLSVGPKMIGAEVAVTVTFPVQLTLVPTPVAGQVTPLVLTVATPNVGVAATVPVGLLLLVVTVTVPMTAAVVFP